MGNSMRKKAYAYQLDQYSKVPLTSLSDESDEEDISYGHNVGQKIELQLIPPQSGKSTWQPKPEQKVLQPDPKNGTVILWISCVLVVCVVIAVVGYLRWITNGENDNDLTNTTSPVISYPNGRENQAFMTTESTPPDTSKPVAPHAEGKDWEQLMKDYASESCVRLLDVDNDGMLDIILGVTESSILGTATVNKDKSPIEFCKQMKMSYPCIGSLVALRGSDGSVIWKTHVQMAVIFMNCEDFDINSDGQKDCIVTGRQATLQAVNSKNGETLWLGDEKFMKQKWNTYQVLALPDFDLDGVPEVLVANGGDPDKQPEEHDRKSGRLILLSGRTGKTIGTRYLAAPNSKEIYMSPVKYTANDKSQYILFGSGGETVPGNFYIISVPDFYRYVTEQSLDADIPHVPGMYKHWQNILKDHKTGLLTILRGQKKGYMTPPVIVDMNKDGIQDLLISAYDGYIILLDGQNLTEIWQTEFPNMESYTSPAPGYFNDDDTLDFMVHWSVGAWPMYTHTQYYIIDGRDGSQILTMNSSLYQMSSDLTLHTAEKHRDLFIFKVHGRESHIVKTPDQIIHGLNRTNQQGKIIYEESHGPLGNPLKKVKRHEKQEKKHYQPNATIDNVFEDYKDRHFLCTDDIDITNEVLLFDRTTMNNPVRLFETGIYKYSYSVPKYANKTYTSKENVTRCIIVRSEDRTTAAIGDVDGDGILDIVSIIAMTGMKVDGGYSYSESVFWTFVKKTSIGHAIKDPKRRTPANIASSIVPNQNDKKLEDVSLLPMEKQSWTEYMGSKGTSQYRT